mmetsp:Transcript_17624/g.61635  ORF Transcript_17624/g.61635 Transcript_17624/m.61635 type:complete len:398 (+) Transcript_17624:1571-2764(+)
MPRPPGQQGQFGSSPPAAQGSARLTLRSAMETSWFVAKMRTCQHFEASAHHKASPSFPLRPEVLQCPKMMTRAPGSTFSSAQTQPRSSNPLLPKRSKRRVTQTRSPSPAQHGHVGTGALRISRCKHSRQTLCSPSQGRTMPSPAAKPQASQVACPPAKAPRSSSSSPCSARAATTLDLACARDGVGAARCCSSFRATSMSSAHATMHHRPQGRATLAISCLNSCVRKMHQWPPPAGTSATMPPFREKRLLAPPPAAPTLEASELRCSRKAPPSETFKCAVLRLKVSVSRRLRLPAPSSQGGSTWPSAWYASSTRPSTRKFLPSSPIFRMNKRSWSMTWMVASCRAVARRLHNSSALVTMYLPARGPPNQCLKQPLLQHCSTSFRVAAQSECTEVSKP